MPLASLVGTVGKPDPLSLPVPIGSMDQVTDLSLERSWGVISGAACPLCDLGSHCLFCKVAIIILTVWACLWSQDELMFVL